MLKAILFTMILALTQPGARNDIVIMIDGSLTFRVRVEGALASAEQYADGLRAIKLPRHETASDRVTIIAVDAFPEVIWRGTIAELKALPRDAWRKRLDSRRDYSGCTDVVRAFQLAARSFDGDPRFDYRTLLVYSDLIHEPPTTTMRTCKPVKAGVPTDFEWAPWRQVAVTVFWVPPDQKLAWSRAASDAGVENFRLLTTTEADAVTPIVPPRAVLSDSIVQARASATRETVEQAASGVGQFLLIAGCAVVGGLILLGFAASAARSRAARRAPSSLTGRRA